MTKLNAVREFGINSTDQSAKHVLGRDGLIARDQGLVPREERHLECDTPNRNASSEIFCASYDGSYDGRMKKNVTRAPLQGTNTT